MFLPHYIKASVFTQVSSFNIFYSSHSWFLIIYFAHSSSLSVSFKLNLSLQHFKTVFVPHKQFHFRWFLPPSSGNLHRCPLSHPVPTLNYVLSSYFPFHPHFHTVCCLSSCSCGKYKDCIAIQDPDCSCPSAVVCEKILVPHVMLREVRDLTHVFT